MLVHFIISWHVTPCGLLSVRRCFGGTFCELVGTEEIEWWREMYFIKWITGIYPGVSDVFFERASLLPTVIKNRLRMKWGTR
jgi:hypothetical protein